MLRTRPLAVVLAMALFGTILALAASPVDAAGGRPGGGTTVDFDISGYRCSLTVIDERVLGNGTVIVRTEQSGFTDSSIALMDGTLDVTATAVIPPNRPGFTVGRWTLQPDASTGSISGRFRGTITGAEDTELVSTGRGRGALRGVHVRMTTTTPAPVEGAPCPTDLAFTGSGTARAPRDRAPIGAVVAQSLRSFDDSVAHLTAAIEANANLRLIAVIDHRAAAASRDLELRPTTEVFFGNPNLGTPLMQGSQTTGIDLPQKILVWEDLFGVVRVGYNAPAYLQSRHAIEGADGQLQTVAAALAGLASTATGTTVEPVFDAGQVEPSAGLVVVESAQSAADGYAAILAAVDAAPPVNLALTVEHDVNAAAVGRELRPTKLVVFGNPSLGTLLMQTDQSVALDLPQKMLVYEDADGRALIAYNDPHYIARRHGVRGQDDVLDTLAGALAAFAAAGQ